MRWKALEGSGVGEAMILTPELRKLYRERWIKAKAGGYAPLNENVDNLFDTLDELERQLTELQDKLDAAREIRERKSK